MKSLLILKAVPCRGSIGYKEAGSELPETEPEAVVAGNRMWNDGKLWAGSCRGNNGPQRFIMITMTTQNQNEAENVLLKMTVGFILD